MFAKENAILAVENSVIATKLARNVTESWEGCANLANFA
jgi:hypothetical protein